MEYTDFIRLINTRDWGKRLDALETDEDVPRGILLLAARACLTDSNDSVRRASADLLGWLGSTRDNYRLLLASHDPSWDVRSSAVGALGALRAKGATKRVEEMLATDPHFVVRRDAAWALAKVSVDAESVLRRRLIDEKDDIVKVAIYQSLYVLGDQRALDEVLSYFDDEDFLVRDNAINGLQFLTVVESDVGKIVQALDITIELDPNPGVRGNAQELRKAIMSGG